MLNVEFAQNSTDPDVHRCYIRSVRVHLLSSRNTSSSENNPHMKPHIHVVHRMSVHSTLNYTFTPSEMFQLHVFSDKAKTVPL